VVTNDHPVIAILDVGEAVARWKILLSPFWTYEKV
jgi:hypothetical protein